MAKVTSKLQLTVPKAIADQYGIRPGDALEFVAAGETIHLIPQKSAGVPGHRRSVEERLKLFRQMLERQRLREQRPERLEEPVERPWKPHEIARGWRREDLYARGRSR